MPPVFVCSRGGVPTGLHSRGCLVMTGPCVLIFQVTKSLNSELASACIRGNPCPDFRLPPFCLLERDNEATWEVMHCRQGSLSSLEPK